MQCLFDTGDTYKVLPNFDGAVYDVAVGADCICGGVGDEFTLTYSASSLTVSFHAGSEAVIGGAFFKVTEDQTVTLSANSTIYLCARIDKTQPNGQHACFALNTESSIQKQNLNGSGTIRDLLLYTVTTSANGVTAIQDKRVIRTSESTQVGGLTLWTGTQAEYDAIPSKDSKTIYFIKES